MNALAALTLGPRMIIGVVGAAAIALGALRAGALTRDGAVAAWVEGAVAVSAGWAWSLVLIVYFVLSTSLTRWRREAKLARTAGIVDKGGERDARQVLANGGFFCLSALMYIVGSPHDGVLWIAFGVGTLAASTADTWGTEFGIAAGGTPRSILAGHAVEPGTSGGVSIAGTLAAMSGAAVVGALVLVVGWPVGTVPGIMAGGILGALLDSLVGATLQERRHCPACGVDTEQPTHRCGTLTGRTRGIRGLDNDMVNLVTSAAGGLLAMGLAR